MKFLGQDHGYRTVVILGAGASFGDNNLVGNQNNMYRPPLDANFVASLALYRQKLSPNYNDVLEKAKEHFGTFNGIGLEQLLTRIESSCFLSRVGAHSQTKFKAIKEEILEFDVAAEPIRLAIRDVLCKSVGQLWKGDATRPCWHTNLAINSEDKDTVVSFNYDTIIDHFI